MSSSPLHRGDFVWCAFPEGEHPDVPSQHRHIAYVVTVADPTGAQTEHRAMVAYTTSQPWPLAAQRPGVVPFALDRARALGQQHPFVLHLWRAAIVPVTPEWFPLLSAPDAGVVGRASEALKRELEAKLKDVLTRHRGSMDVLGPDRPRR